MKIIRRTSATMLGVALLLAPISEALAQSATVTLSSQKQYIRGFGGMTHAAWAGDLTAAERTLAFGSGDGQLGFSVLRIPVTDGNPDSVNVATAKAAIADGAIVFATPWNAAGTYTSAQFAAYATHLNNFVSYMKNQGVDLYAISVQNEPDYGAQAGWGSWTAAACHDFVLNYGATITTKLMSCESYSYNKTYYDPILNDPAALANMDVLGTHLYGTAVSAYAYPLFDSKGAGKERWMTEHYTDSTSDANSWPNALGVASELHNAMVTGQFDAYTWWYIKRSYGFLNNGAVTKRGWCMGHWSKFVRPGFYRVDATAAPSAGLALSAYKGDSTVVITVVNTNASSSSLAISIPGSTIASFTKYTTSSSKSLASDGMVSASNGSLNVSLDASSVTTFVGSGDTGAGGGTGAAGSSGMAGSGGSAMGGSSSTGGSSAGGGSSNGGGSPATGGSPAAGGMSNDGGDAPSGGALSAGGFTATGGSGAVSAAGSPSSSGGALAAGGSAPATGGAISAGGSGATSAGTVGSAGDSNASDNAGCSCSLAGQGSKPKSLALFGALGMLGLAWRRRRSRG